MATRQWATASTQNTLRYLKEGLRNCVEAHDTGIEVLDELGRQRELIADICDSTQRIHTTLGESEQKLTDMENPWLPWQKKIKTTKHHTPNVTKFRPKVNLRGWVNKRGKVFKTWKRRYFRLDLEARAILYYKTDTATRPKGHINLVGATVTELGYAEAGKDSTFSISEVGKKTPIWVEVCVPGDYQLWLSSLKRSIGGAEGIPSTPRRFSSSTSQTKIRNDTSALRRDGLSEQESVVLDHIIDELDGIAAVAYATRDEIDVQNQILKGETNSLRVARQRAAQAGARCRRMRT